MAKAAAKKTKPEAPPAPAWPVVTYSVQYDCTNCDDGTHFIEIPKGRIANEFLAALECGRCGCKQVLKTVE